jgi:hypothetical protein
VTWKIRKAKRHTYLFLRVIKSRRLTWARHVARIWERRDENSVLVRKPEEESPLIKPRPVWDDNIKMDFRKVGRGYGLDRGDSGQGQVAGSCE